MSKILFITLVDASFVKLDESILSEKYDLIKFQFRYRKGWRVIPEIFRQLWFVLVRIWTADLVYVWFADFHAVVPTIVGRLFGKKVMIVVGGYDAANRKDLNYGVKTKLIGRISARLSLKFASHLLPVTRFTMDDLIANFGNKLRNKCHVIYNSYNHDFHCNNQSNRTNTVVTICLAHSVITVIRKGVDFFLLVAREIPDTKFIVVGLSSEALEYVKERSTQNVQLIEKIPQVELIEILCRSKVICQFSRYEAFGVALLEGIAAGCFPVGYNYGGTKEILIDGQGILINELSLEKGVAAINKALAEPPNAVIPIQKYISENFAIEVRQTALISFINQLFKK
jgi:glycosyltransferase involved in cell wall biosynthesis